MAEELCKISRLVIAICSTVIWEPKEIVSEGVCHRSPKTLVVASLSLMPSFVANLFTCSLFKAHDRRLNLALLKMDHALV